METLPVASSLVWTHGSDAAVSLDLARFLRMSWKPSASWIRRSGWNLGPKVHGSSFPVAVRSGKLLTPIREDVETSRHGRLHLEDSFLEDHVKNLSPPDFLKAWLLQAKVRDDVNQLGRWAGLPGRRAEAAWRSPG